MDKRAAAVEETRRRIVDATVALHAEQGIRTTSFDEVAERADVALATVYRHFPTLDRIVMACGERIAELIRPPSPADAKRLFAGVRGLRGRIGRLVDELCDFYERGEAQLATAYREASYIPAVAESVNHHDATRRALAREVLRPAAADEEALATVVGITAFPAWKALLDAGLDEQAARDAVKRLASCAVRGAGSRASN